MKTPTIDERSIEHKVLGLNEGHPIEVMNQDPAHGDSAVVSDMHYELEMGIVLKGTMTRYAGNSRRICEAGDMWFSGMWEPHAYRGGNRCHRVVIVIWPPILASLRLPEARNINWMQPFLTSPDDRPIIPIELRDGVTRLVEHHIGQGGRMTPPRKRLLVMELLLFLFEHRLVGRAANNAAPEPERIVHIMPAIDLAFERSDLITNEAAAKICGLSRDIFIRSFRRLMGVSFSKFAMRHRLNRAAEQLAKTHTPIKAIAREWGFTDASHLHRLFTQHYGCTPLTYRESLGRDT
jgi:AraC-like DNA-binding protein/quercetin dioxygenase-like cupin family protein